MKCTLLQGDAEHGVVLGNTVKGHPSLFLLIAPPRGKPLSATVPEQAELAASTMLCTVVDIAVP